MNTLRKARSLSWREAGEIDPRQVTVVHRSGQDLEGLDPHWLHERPNIQVIWLHANRIADLTFLSSCMRLRELFLHQNEIRSISPLIELKNLIKLFLYDNEIANFTETRRIVTQFLFLEHLDLSGNPLTQEKGYKESFIAACPMLQFLDRHKVFRTAEAQAKHYEENSLSFGSRKPLPLPKSPPQGSWIDSEVARIEKRRRRREREGGDEVAEFKEPAPVDFYRTYHPTSPTQYEL